MAEKKRNLTLAPANDGFDPLRAEYNQMLVGQYRKGNNGITRTKYLTFGIHADSMKQALPRIIHVQNDLINNFRQMGVYARVLDGMERLEVMHAQRFEEAFYSGKGRSSAEEPAPDAGAAGDAATLMKLLTNPETAGLLKALVNAMGNEESK